MKLLKDWPNRSYRCFFCGETRSVKYEVEIIDPVIGNKPTLVCACNKCVLLMGRKGAIKE